MATTTVNLPVIIALTSDQAKKWDNDSKTLSVTATHLIQEQTRGGMMLPADTVEQIGAIVGEIQRPDDVLTAVENANHRVAGRYRAEIFIDPQDEGFYRDLAISSGRGTVEQMFQDEVNYYGDQGWGNQLPDCARIKISFEQRQTLEEVLGISPVTGEDIVNFILEHVTLPAPLAQAVVPSKPSNQYQG